LAVLVGTFVLTILYTGNYYLFGGNQNFINAFKNTDQSFLAICLAGLTSLATGILIALPRRKLRAKELPGMISGWCATHGISLLANCLFSLGTGLTSTFLLLLLFNRLAQRSSAHSK
jgi:hypothetical protein